MGPCQGKKISAPSKEQSTFGRFEQAKPAEMDTPLKCVTFFNQPEFAQYMEQQRASCEFMIADILKKVQSSPGYSHSEMVQAIMDANELNAVRILRSYQENSEKALRVVQKIKEYFTNYYTRYIDFRDELVVVKQTIINESIQLGIEHLIIVNNLLHRSFTPEQVWWTEEYFRGRAKLIRSTYPHIFTQESIDKFHCMQSQQPVNDPVLEHFMDQLVCLKVRVSVTISLLQSREVSLFVSHNKSIQIQDAQLQHFYQDLKDAMLLSQPNSEQLQQEKKTTQIQERKQTTFGEHYTNGPQINDQQQQ